MKPTLRMELTAMGETHASIIEVDHGSPQRVVMEAARTLAMRVMVASNQITGWPVSDETEREKILWLLSRAGHIVVQKGKSLMITWGEGAHWRKYMFEQDGTLKSVIEDGVNISGKVKDESKD